MKLERMHTPKCGNILKKIQFQKWRILLAFKCK